MSGGLIAVCVLVFVGFILVAWVAGMYNGLVGLKNRCEEAWSQIDVQLKRRRDLIPNLVETAKGYMSHEKETLEGVIKARQQTIDASGLKNQMAAENFLTQALGKLMAVSEAYPDLKANESMQGLMEELTTTENKISFSRQYYNDSVKSLNDKVEMFPSNIIAGMFNFMKREFFEIVDPTEREVVKVKF